MDGERAGVGVMNGGAVPGGWLTVTADLADDGDGSFVAEVRAVVSIERVAKKVLLSAEAPSLAQLVAEVITWKAALALPAYAFLSQLGKNACDEAWKRRGEVVRWGKAVAVAPLLRLARALVAIQKREQFRTEARVGLPVPTLMRGALLAVNATDEAEAAWLLANFIVNAEGVEKRVRELVEQGVEAREGFRIVMDGAGKVGLEWYTRERELRRAELTA